MAGSTPDQVILGLYRHDVPETQTLRHVLKWLAPQSVLMPEVSPLSSLEEARERVRFAEFERELEASRAEEHEREEESPQQVTGSEQRMKSTGDFTRLLRELGPKKEAPRLDEDVIDRIVAANDAFPRRAKVMVMGTWSSPPIYLPHWKRQESLGVKPVPLSVGYASTRPDDPRAEGWRLVTLSVSLAEWRRRVPRPGPPAGSQADRVPEAQQPPGMAFDAATAAARLELLLCACCWGNRVDYANIQHGREPPGPRALLRSDEPRDFDRLYIRMSADAKRPFLAACVDDADWSVFDVLSGVYIIRRDRKADLSAQGQRLMHAVRAILAASLAK